jgi:hypothetical protein
MRVLIVSPHFPPTNTPDMQRARLVLPYLRENGVEAEVLAVEPEQVASPRDPWLVEGLPAEVPIHRVKAMSLAWSRVPSLGTLPYRAMRALRLKGSALLAARKFDLVYFSTTAFPVHTLGPIWKKAHGVPFAMDYQDPWTTDYYRDHPEVTPPGGRLKYAISEWIARRQEPGVLRKCSGVTCVSPAYPEDLARRYPEAKFKATAVLPFPCDDRDFLRAASGVGQTVFDPADGLRHWVYVGVVPPSMRLTVRALFKAMARGKAADLRAHFIGTSYAGPGKAQPAILPLAREEGVEHMVTEMTDRIPYSQALRCLADADAVLALGSDDSSYTASKIYPCLLARKPLLAIFHEDSSVTEVMARVGGGQIVTFRSQDSVEAIAARIPDHITPVELNETAFARHTAQSQAAELAAFWRAVA